MSRFLLLVLVLFTSLSYGQDKIYLKNNSLIEAKIIEEQKDFIEISLIDHTSKILKTDIAVIIYENGHSSVLSKSSSNKKDINRSEWMVGTNILQPLSLSGGFMIEKNITGRYSIRAGQLFLFDGYYGGFRSCTSLMNNFYFGKGRAKWLVSTGLNVLYNESPYNYPYPYSPYLADYETMDIIWLPPNGWSTFLETEFSLGTGLYIDLTKHCSFLMQVNLSYLMDPNYFDIHLDLANSGFSFFYKF